MLITQALDDHVSYLLLHRTDPVDVPSTCEEDEHDADFLPGSHPELDNGGKREDEQIQVVEEVDHARGNAENLDDTSWVAALLSGHASKVGHVVGSTLGAANHSINNSGREVEAKADTDTDIYEHSDVSEGAERVEDETVDGELDDPDQERRRKLDGQ